MGIWLGLLAEIGLEAQSARGTKPEKGWAKEYPQELLASSGKVPDKRLDSLVHFHWQSIFGNPTYYVAEWFR